MIRRQEDRHVQEPIADRHVLDVGDFLRTGGIRRQGQRLVRRQFKRLFLELVPDRLVDAVRVADDGENRSTTNRLMSRARAPTACRMMASSRYGVSLSWRVTQKTAAMGWWSSFPDGYNLTGVLPAVITELEPSSRRLCG